MSMVRRYPALSVATSVYAVAVVVFALAPWPAYEHGVGIARAIGVPGAAVFVDAAVDLVIFVPFGVLVSLLLVPRRRVSAFVIVVLAASWVELAQLVWMPSREPSVMCMLAQCLGGALGVGAVMLASGTAHRAGRRHARSDRASRLEITVPRG